MNEEDYAKIRNQVVSTLGVRVTDDVINLIVYLYLSKSQSKKEIVE